MIIENICYHTRILTIPAGEMKLAAVYHRMPVCEGIYMTVYYDALPNPLRILQVITALYIIANIIANNDIIRVA